MVNSETSEVQRSAQGVCGGVVLWGTNEVGVKIEVRGGSSVTQLDDGTPDGEKVRCGAEARRSELFGFQDRIDSSDIGGRVAERWS